MIVSFPYSHLTADLNLMGGQEIGKGNNTDLSNFACGSYLRNLCCRTLLRLFDFEPYSSRKHGNSSILLIESKYFQSNWFDKSKFQFTSRQNEPLH